MVSRLVLVTCCVTYCVMFSGGCHNYSWKQRGAVYDGVMNNNRVVADDLKTRALERAGSAYAAAVARLEVMTQKAKELLEDKARAEDTDPAVFISWIDRADAAHDEKLKELGQERDAFIAAWKQRYGTLEKNGIAIQALKDHEQKIREKIECPEWYKNLGLCNDVPFPSIPEFGGNLGVLGGLAL